MFNLLNYGNILIIGLKTTKNEVSDLIKKALTSIPQNLVSLYLIIYSKLYLSHNSKNGLPRYNASPPTIIGSLGTQILAFCCGYQSMNKIGRDFNSDEAIHNINHILKTNYIELPHKDTLINVIKEEFRKFNSRKKSKRINS